jgi:hypothetical protein
MDLARLSHLTAIAQISRSNGTFAYNLQQTPARIQMPPVPQRSNCCQNPPCASTTHKRHGSNSLIPPPQPQRSRRPPITAREIDWTAVPNAHDTLGLNISECWNMCSACSNVQSACYQTKDIIIRPLATLRNIFWAFVTCVNAGIFFAAFWLSTVYTPFHYWFMDTMKGKRAWKGLCGNKFMECRPWD